MHYNCYDMQLRSNIVWGYPGITHVALLKDRIPQNPPQILEVNPRS
jgi:hypothetical protein